MIGVFVLDIEIDWVFWRRLGNKVYWNIGVWYYFKYMVCYIYYVFEVRICNVKYGDVIKLWNIFNWCLYFVFFIVD